MVTEDYVSFEVAKLLKGKMFNGLCTAYYDYFTTDNFHCGNEPTDFNSIDTKIRKIVAAPTLQMAMKWLREVHNLYIWIGHAAGKGLSWYYEIHGISDGKVKHIGGIQCGSYEVACEVAIKCCLTNLI